MAGDFFVSVLGPTELRRGDDSIVLRPKERAVVAALALRHRRPSTTDDLVALIWPHDPPDSARKAVQNHVLRIRRATGAGFIDTVQDAYSFDAGVRLDTEELAETVARAGDAARRRHHEQRRELLETVARRYRDEPFADLAPSVGVMAARRRLIELREGVEDALAEALLATGDVAAAIESLSELVEQSPYRERRWWLLMLAHYRAGRRRDALATFGHARGRLVDGVGLDPGDDLRRLERLIGDDDPVLLTGALLETTPQQTVPGAPREIFVGRESELERLHSALERAADGNPAFVVVEGEAGIGKTMLAREFAAASAPRARVVWGPCDAAPATPLQPFGRALDALIDSSPDEFPAWLPPDPAPLAAVVPRLARRLRGPPDDPGASGPYRLFDAVADALIVAGRDRPLVVILDDFHLAPPATRRLVDRCLDAETRLLLLATWRTGASGGPPPDDPTQDTRAEILRLRGLRRPAIGEWLVKLVGPDLDARAAAEWMHDQTGGNPLFVRELTRALVEREAFAHGATEFTAPDDVPDALRDVLLERLRALAADTVAFLRAASVLGVRFRPADLQVLVDTAPARQLAEASAAGMVEPGRDAHEVQFTHELLQRVLYETLAGGTRVELHDLAAQSVESADDADARVADIAWHRLAAAPLDAEQAVSAAQRAGDTALASFAYDDAARFFEGARAAATLLGPEGDRRVCELSVARGDALRRAGDPGNVAVLHEAAGHAERLGDGDLVAAASLALCQLGPTSEAGGADDAAAELADLALEQATDPRLRAQVAGAASMVHSLADAPDRCRALFERAEREARDVGDPVVLSAVLPYAYLSLSRPEDLERRAAIADELVTIGQRRGHLPTEWEGHQLRFSVRLVQGDAALGDSFSRLATITATVREPTREWSLGYLAAALSHLRGELDRAEDEITASLEYEGAVSASRVLAAYGGQLLGIRADQGRLGELAPTIEALLEDQAGVPAWHAAMAWIAAEAGDTARVRQEYDRLAADEFIELPRDFVWTAAMYVLGRSVAAVGDADRSRKIHDRLAPSAGRMSWFGTGTYGPVDLALGECLRVLGDEDAARTHLEAAARISARLDAPLFEAAARTALGGIA